MTKDILVDKVIYIPFYFNEVINKYCFAPQTLTTKTCKQFQNLCLNSFKKGMICNFNEGFEIAPSYFSFEEYNFYNVSNNQYGAIFLPFNKSFYDVTEYVSLVLAKNEEDTQLPPKILNKMFKTTVFKKEATIKILEHFVF